MYIVIIVALKKPSEYFKKETSSVSNSVQELVKAPELNTFSDAFESFKKNLGKIEVLSEFSETLDNYRVNIERVNFLSEKVEDIQTEIQNLLKKEDLDRAMMSQLLVVEQSILDVQNKVKGIDEKNLTEIRLDVAGLTESVSEFLEVEVPKYKKLVVDSELRTNDRYEEFESNVNSTLEGIGEFVDRKYEELTESLQGINENSLSGIVEDFKKLDEAVLELKEQEIPKYKGFIVETERKTEDKLNEFDKKVDETLVGFDEKIQESIESLDGKIDNKLNIFQETIEKIDEDFEVLREQEIPKYKSFIVETELKSELKLKEFDKKLNQTVESLLEKVNLIKGDKTDLVNVVNKKIKEIKNIRDYVIEDLKSSDEYKKEINKKVTELEVEIIRNESHIRKQNENLDQIQEDVRFAIEKLNIDELEEKNYELGKKVKYLEEVFERFNQDTLTEGLLNEPPQIENKDPLTPLDQNFVTLEQLQQHYRLFISRIQQQLATIGGGGETRLEFLDDVDRTSAKQNGYVLQYNSATGKFIGTSYVPGSGGTGEISIQKDGSVIGTAVTVLNFSGAGISTITSSAGIATITIPSSTGGTVRTVTSYTATEGETTFAATYNVGYVDVFLNGVKLSQSQYIASNGTSVFLTEGASADDVVEIVAFTGFNVSANTISGVVVNDEGNLVGASVTSFNFVGTGVSATVVGSDATITFTGGTGGESYWSSTNAGIHTLSNVGIGTTNPTSKLFVEGDARITGILSVGQGTVTINGITNTVNVDNLVVGTTLTGPGGVGYATVGYVTQQISNLVDGAPGALDTLNELAAALNDDENFATTVTNSLALKAPINNANLTGITTTGLLNVGVGGTIITTVGVGSTTYVGIGSTQPRSTLVVNAPSGYTGNILDLRHNGYQNMWLVAGQQNATDPILWINGKNGGAVQITSSAITYPSGSWASISMGGGTASSTNGIFMGVGGVAGFQIGSNIPFSFGNDVKLARDDANVLAQRNAGIGQTFRIYNTYTSASQYERAYLGWNNNVFQIGVNTAGISTARSISLVGAAGSNTGDTLQPLQINQTWTAGTGIATAITLNVTNTSSSGSSNLLDLRVNGASQFQIGNPSGSANITRIGRQGSSAGPLNYIEFSHNVNGQVFFTNGQQTFVVLGSNVRVASGGVWFGAASDQFNGPFLLNDGDAPILAQRNGTVSQTFRVYNTYTSSTNFERANVGWTTNRFIVGTEKGSAGGTARQLELQTDGTTRVAITTTGLIGIGTTTPTSKLTVDGDASFTDTRLNSVSEKSTVVSGNTVSLVYNTGGGNIAICTNPTGPITLNITGIPTDSTFDNRVLSFTVVAIQTATGYACTSVTLNGVTKTIKYPGGVISVGSTSSYDIFNFTGINTVGSGSTTANYEILGLVNGNFK